jgi:hypothetical protein
MRGQSAACFFFIMRAFLFTFMKHAAYNEKSGSAAQRSSATKMSAASEFSERPRAEADVFDISIMLNNISQGPFAFPKIDKNMMCCILIPHRMESPAGMHQR